jgi:hypothetical protein
LQDVTIELGRVSLKSVRRAARSLKFTVAEDEAGEDAIERLDIEVRTFSGKLTKISLWQDGTSWVYSGLCKRNSPRKIAVELYANLALLSAVKIAQLLRSTLADLASVYAEWEALSVRKVSGKSKGVTH